MNKFIYTLSLTALMVGASAHAMNYNTERLVEEFHGAALEGNTNRVKKMLKEGVPVDIKSVNNWTPLICAACRGHTAICQLLIDHGASIQAKSNCNRTPLEFAGFDGHKETCLLFINIMIKQIQKTQASSIIFLGMKRFRAPAHLNLIDTNVMRLIARQIHNLAMQQKQDLFAQINRMNNMAFKTEMMEYVRQQLEFDSKINGENAHE